ncbi:homeobox domain-containing protein [Microdochium nivale]|nr:homeobox domain-containing protein [Microdochium nivale]
MTTIDELDELAFVNWDAAAPPTGHALLTSTADIAAPNLDNVDSATIGFQEPNLDLVFSNIDGDDFSFWALEHFDATKIPTDVAGVTPLGEIDMEPTLSQMYWVTPDVPCTHCAIGGYQCKRLKEGKYKGYCTSCVALRCECSFGPLVHNLAAEAGETFPANPWPTMGDRPATSILLEDDLLNMTAPAAGLATVQDGAEKQSPPRPQDMSKIGARFSRESVKILKNWVSTHSRHPYPTEDEKETLRKMTGLSKIQITNWLANARRRGKIHVTRAVSPHIGRGYAQAMDIPQRRGLAGSTEDMNPLQRWQNSPPENEPASVTAIARAVSASDSFSEKGASGSGRTSPWISNFSDDGSNRSLYNQSSASSWGTSHSSGGSFASAFSHKSQGSGVSVPSFVRSNRGRRRRRRAQTKPAEEGSSPHVPKTFQCTFCTETFRTKHDWQRHEKSLHLSLERWVCSPDGPTFINPDNGLPSCVFCGEASPDEAHVDSHNFSNCTERTQAERTFYRKDHLRQHLKLVHNVKFSASPMETWRANSPAIRSRCGFCGIALENWPTRVDHLAEHFKTGHTMANWKGDWGFDHPILDLVENAFPPYLIDEERKSPYPYKASDNASASPNNAYELLKMEMQYWMTNFVEEQGRPSSETEARYEAYRVIVAAEVSAKCPLQPSGSWLRDLVIASGDRAGAPVFLPARTQSENKIALLRINGKSDIYEGCELETQLHDFVRARILLGLTAMDSELQAEACRIIGRIEEKSSSPSDDFANFLVNLINSSQTWLADFRQRAHLPRSEDLLVCERRSKDPSTIDSTIHNYTRLDQELGEYLQTQRSIGLEPSDADLQRQARIIIYDIDDEWNQTAADDKCWLAGFYQRYPPPASGEISSLSSSPGSHDMGHNGTTGAGPDITCMDQPSTSHPSLSAGPYFLNDANCYRRLFRGLKRFVITTMSENNPSRHVPTDQELQHQARWIVYDDDDPWNQTAADNVEWLHRFKREAGLLPADSGPGLDPYTLDWTSPRGGTGFAPPYIYPNPAAVIRTSPETSNVIMREEAKTFPANAATTSRYVRTFTKRHEPPARIFCSRELETGLTEFVRREVASSGVLPSDAALRTRACGILGMQKTACDDPVLFAKFKEAMQQSMAIIPIDSSMAASAPGSIEAEDIFDFESTIAPPLVSSSAAGMGGLRTSPLAPAFTETTTGMIDEFVFTEKEMTDILDDIGPLSGADGFVQPPQQDGNSIDLAF